MEDKAELFYLASDGKALGPFRLDYLLDLARNGEVKKTDLVWHARLEGWTEIGNLPVGLGEPRPSFRMPSPLDSLNSKQPKFEVEQPLVFRNSLYLTAATAGLSVTFVAGLSLLGEFDMIATAILLLGTSMLWWAYHEYLGIVVTGGRIFFCRRIRFWPWIFPLSAQSEALSSVAIGRKFAYGTSSHCLTLRVGGDEHVLVFNETFQSRYFRTYHGTRCRGRF